MKSSRNAVLAWSTALIALVLGAGVARAAGPWALENLANIEKGTALEAVFYRLMQMPGGAVSYRRPPGETRGALTELAHKTPNDAQLYMLRAIEDERQLDFAAAENDWKTYLDKSQDKAEAHLQLADFYHRRLRPANELEELLAAGAISSPASEQLTAVNNQRSWRAFERALTVIDAQALGTDATRRVFRDWMARYPASTLVEARYFEYLLAAKDFAAAQLAIADYAKRFPSDRVFPVKSRALLDYRKGSIDEGLAVYEKSFEPLWPAELVQSYMQLVKATHRERQMLDGARAALAANPDDLNAMARIFFYYQQQGRLDTAQQAITDFRLSKEDRKAAWKAQELYTLAKLLDAVHAYPESARYYFALYNAADAPDGQERALVGVVNVLLTAPEQPIRLGSGELSMYSDIGRMDQGPGYFNGILSLWLNTTYIAGEFSSEEQRAVPYFHRAAAAALLAKLDERFPNSTARADLHSRLIDVYADYGDDRAVIDSSKAFLQTFSTSSQRTHVGFVMADAYARTKQFTAEFEIYDALLKELGEKALHMPLTRAQVPAETSSGARPNAAGEELEDGADVDEGGRPAQRREREQSQQRAFSTATSNEGAAEDPAAQEYARVLDRYISRLVSMQKTTDALKVLRVEIDRNPDDPAIYEKLANFLQSNQLWAEQEETYKRAIAKFQDKSWYHKLARWYLRRERNSDYQRLSEQVVKIFSGSELESYFIDAVQGYQSGMQVYLQLNLYAHQRFPHNLSFVRHLLSAYASKDLYNPSASEELLRSHWFEDKQLQDEFFDLLSQRGRLDAEIAAAKALPALANDNWDGAAKENPAAVRFYAEGKLWQSHFEESAAPLGALAAVDPGDEDIAHIASAVFRSLAFYDARNTERAVAIEQNLLKLAPDNREILAKIGDIYADRAQFEKAYPYWRKMPDTEPGRAAAYLDGATVFWDYYRFDEALAILESGRTKLKDPALFAYQAGAIYENKREYPKAVAEYVRGATSGSDEARGRLLQLARRKNTRELVDTATADLANKPSLDAMQLRLAVLDAQDRKAEITKLLMAAVERTNDGDQLDDLQAVAQQRSLEDVRQRALERQADLTKDPVRRLELRYELVRFYETQKNLPAAQRNVEALYHDNPKILGVVRATVDFYWRTKQQQKAIDVLQAAASASYEQLRTNFTYEAARKMTDAGQYAMSRAALEKLLQKDPHNSEYLAAIADNFARAGDDAALRQFYMAKIDEFRKANLRQDSIAALRRGLIPALTRLKDYAGAVDQFIEIINKFPDDNALVTEASLYAQRYGQQDRLVSFYAKTVANSPKDSRWAVALARVQTNLEHFPEAIDAYNKAITIRPDRQDLRIARASLNERLMRFDDAVADYEKLYDLSYKAPAWMEKVAETRARQGQRDAAVQALKVALIDGRPEMASKYFEVAKRLESWGMLDAANNYVEQGVKVAGPDLLTEGENREGLKTWVRLMVRGRKHADAYSRLLQAVETSKQKSTPTPPVRLVVAQVGLKDGLSEIGSTVATYYTPEERLAFRGFLTQKSATMAVSSVEEVLLPMAAREDTALEAQWKYQRLMRSPRSSEPPYRDLLILQRKRLKFDELGHQLENVAATRLPNLRTSLMNDAAEAYRSAGDNQNELRVLEMTSGFDDARYFALLLASKPERLLNIAATSSGDRRDRAAAFIVSNGDASLAQRAVAARGTGLDPVWTKSYRGLVGLYFRDATPPINAAFAGALGGEATVGERLGKQVDRTQQLAGDVWYYYASRYGEYRAIAKNGDPEDYLPAALEMAPARASGYYTMAEYYVENGKTAQALTDFDHVLELQPDRADVRDREAVLLWTQGKHDEALAQWKLVFDGLAKQLRIRKLPSAFWVTYGYTVQHLGVRKLIPQYRDSMDGILRTYVRSNGTYEVDSLLRSTFKALKDPAAGVQWFMDLSTVAPEPDSFLAEVQNAKWIPDENREPMYLRRLQTAQTKFETSAGASRDYTLQSLARMKLQYAEYLLGIKQSERANGVLQAMTSEERTATAESFISTQLKIAAKLNMVDSIIEGFRRDPDHAPAQEMLRTVAKEIQQAGDKANARKILEFVFARDIEQHNLAAPTFLGLADIRLEAGDVAGAMELLRRMTLTTGTEFENLDSAASLLVQHERWPEAADFLQQLVTAVPWNPSYRVRLAEAQLKANREVANARKRLTEIAADAGTPYAVRVNAARDLAGSGAVADLHGGELKIVATGESTAAEANKPFYYEARMVGAKKAAEADRLSLYRGAVEDFPDRPAARVAFFESAVAAKQYETALASLDSMLQGQITGANPDEEAESDEGAADSEDDDERDYSAEWVLGKLPQDKRRALMLELGTAFEALQRPEEALRVLRVAVTQERDKQQRADLDARVKRLQDEIARRKQNASRQPEIHPALEQSRVVRPRLVARSAAKPDAVPQRRPR